jgi:GDP-L-fucose synthase
MELEKDVYCKNTELMQSHINVGFGVDVTIAELAEVIANATGYQGIISFDPSKPDGAPRKWMDSTRLENLGWQPRTNLPAGLATAYSDYVKSYI